MMREELATDTGRGRVPRARNMAIDWLAVKRDYCAGDLSLRLIGEKHGCAHSTIANYAGRHRWARATPLSSSGPELPTSVGSLALLVLDDPAEQEQLRPSAA